MARNGPVRRFAAARVLIAEADAGHVAGMRQLLQPEFEVIDLPADTTSLADAVQRHRPDVVITDLTRARIHGLDALRSLRGAQVKTVAVTALADRAVAAAAFSAGATGCVVRETEHSDLLTAVREVLAGRTYITARAIGPAVNTPRSACLTARQREVLQLIVNGVPTKHIAARLNISRRTVEAHKLRVMRVLGVHNTAELVQHALVHGLVRAPALRGS